MKRFCVAVLIACTCVMAVAQEAAQVFRSGSNLVLVPVIVENKDGSHATGLSKEGFAVEQDGLAQKLAVFSEVAPMQGQFKVVKPESPNQFTNAVPRDEVRRLVIIVFDLIFTPSTDRAKARAYLEEYVAKNVDSQQPTALLVAEANGMTQLQTFTSDPRVLLAALRKITSGSPDPVKLDDSNVQFRANDPNADFSTLKRDDVSDVVRMVRAMMANRAEAQERYETNSRIDQLLSSFASIGNAYSGIPGRKALIWVTSGFPFARYDKGTSDLIVNTAMFSGPEMNKISASIRGLASANIAMYPVDARGVTTGLEDKYSVERFGLPERLGTDQPNEDGSAEEQPSNDESRSNLDTMEKFARETGGKVCTGRNDLDTCLKKAVDDSSQYYLLGFYLSPEERTPGWHKLSVKVNGKELAVRARQRFYVESSMGASMNWLETVKEAATSPINYTGVQFAAERGAATADGKTTFTFTIPVSALTRPDGQLSVEVISFVEDGSGNIRLEDNKRLEANVSEKSMRQQMRSGIKYTAAVKVGTSDKAVKLAVRDNYNQTIGTIRIPL